MANAKQLAILKKSVESWNQWRAQTPDVHVDLRRAKLHLGDLSRANLRNVDLSEAALTRADLSGADLNASKLINAQIEGNLAVRGIQDVTSRFGGVGYVG